MQFWKIDRFRPGLQRNDGHFAIHAAGSQPLSVEFPGFSGQTLASAFSRRSDAEVQAPDPRESANRVRIHQGASKPVQRTADVPRARGGAERLLRLADTAGVEPLARRRPAAAAGSGVFRSQEDARLLRLVRASFVASHGIYGAPRVFLDLREAGETCSKHRVARLM